MNYANYRLALDLADSSSQFLINVRKGETKRRLYISLFNGSEPYSITEGCYAVFKATKPDNTILANTCSITSDSTIIYDITEQTNSVSGILACQIELRGEDGELLYSPRFDILVDESIVEESIIKSANETNAIEYVGNKVTSVSATSTDSQYPSAKAVYTSVKDLSDSTNQTFSDMQASMSSHASQVDSSLAAKEDISNKSTQVSASSTDKQYPSAKAVYNAVKSVSDTVTANHTELSTNKADKSAVSNAVTHTVSGETVTISDISPITHTLGVKVRSKNLIAYPYYDNTTTLAGITYTDNGDGTIGVSGTATSYNTYFRLQGGFTTGKVEIPSWLVPGETYTISSGNATVNAQIYLYKEDGTSVILQNTFVVPSGYAYYGIFLLVGNGKTASGTVYPMLKKGPSSSGYIPYVKPTAVTVTVGDKTYTPDADGKVSGITSEYPTMALSTDNANVSLDVTYNRDLDAYLKTLSPAAASLTIYANKWEQVDIGNGVYQWQQVVNVNNAVITPNSKVDLKLSAEQVSVFYNKSLAFVTENEDGVVTVCCIGVKPTNDYTIQVNVTEVVVNG